MEGIGTSLKDLSIKGAEPKCFMGQIFQSFRAHITLTLVQLLLMVCVCVGGIQSVTICFIKLVPKSGKDYRLTPSGSRNTTRSK